MYADDVLLIATSTAALQKLIDDTTRFFQLAGMDVNPSKSDIVIFSRADRFLNEHVTIDAVPKDIADEARYLGVIFERGGSWKLQKDATQMRCRSALGRCKVICKSLGLTRADVMTQIFDMFSASIARYSLGAWGPLAGDLSFLDKIFSEFVRSRYNLPRSTSIEGTLMQFGRRCASCDAFFLAAVQVARGLTNPTSVWGHVIATTIADTRIRWVRNVTTRLVEMGLSDEVFENPTTFLERRKDYGVVFSQYCHHRHLVFSNGTSADLFRIDRPFGVYPFLSALPSFRARFVLLLIMSCWRWSSQDSRAYPENCPVCRSALNSPHIMFECPSTSRFRDDFKRATGEDFSIASLQSTEHVDAIDIVCERIYIHVTSM
jgi:hypothetical protein